MHRHFTDAGCVLLFGGGVRGSSQIGGTDDLLESLSLNYTSGEPDPSGELNKYDNMAAGLLDMLEVDPERWLPGVVPFRGMQS